MYFFPASVVGLHRISIRRCTLSGAPLYGLLEACGIGPLKAYAATAECADFENDCERHNKCLLGTLKADANADELRRQTQENVMKGRMSEPAPAAGCDLKNLRAHRRFSIEQGRR